MKKIAKILGITFLCFVAFIVVGIGIIIFKGMHPAKTPAASNKTTEDSSAATVSDTSSEDDESEYIDTPTYDEFRLYAEKPSELPVFLSDSAYVNVLEDLNGQAPEFRVAEYYAMDQALNMYRDTHVEKSEETTLLTNGMLDTDKLIRAVNRNNNAVIQNGKNTLNVLFAELEASEIATICKEIAKVINDKSDEFNIKQIANTLEKLTMFKRTGSTSFAYVTTDLTFIYNPITTGNYETILDITNGSSEDAWERVIDHEIMHLIQYSSSDNDNDNGIEIGFSRKYDTPEGEKQIPVNSLYFPWILEAGAELKMADYLGVEPGTYEKKRSYATSYNFSRFYDNAAQENALEKVAFKHTLEEAFAELGVENENEQEEFLKFMYSVEVTQSDTEDFWEYYESQTGKTLTDEEKLGVRMDIRTDAVRYLTKNFFDNLINAIHDGAVADLDTAFYLLRLWELDTFNHLNYTQESSLKHAEDFILWYNKTQNAILSAVAESSNLDSEQVKEMYCGYSLQLENEKKENCDLGKLSTYMQEYILGAKKSYRSSKYSRIYDVAKLLEV